MSGHFSIFLDTASFMVAENYLRTYNYSLQMLLVILKYNVLPKMYRNETSILNRT